MPDLVFYLKVYNAPVAYISTYKLFGRYVLKEMQIHSVDVKKKKKKRNHYKLIGIRTISDSTDLLYHREIYWLSSATVVHKKSCLNKCYWWQESGIIGVCVVGCLEQCQLHQESIIIGKPDLLSLQFRRYILSITCG